MLVNIIGHQKIIDYLDKSIEKGNVSHAYLFSGPAHIGKFSVALKFAQKLTGASDQAINPDIFLVSPEIEEKKGIIKKKGIKIEDIRELQKKLSLTSYFGKYRVALVDESDYLTTSAQNALLKTLEEPEDKCVIILISQNREKIIETVRSRCVIKNFGLVCDSEIEKMVGDSPNKEEIIFWSFGRPGVALELKNNPQSLKDLNISKEELEKIIGGNLSETMPLAEKIAKDVLSLSGKIELWMAILRKKSLSKDILLMNSFKISPEKALFAIQKMGESLKLLRETNANARLILENLFLIFR